MSSKASSGGIGFGGLLTVLFIGLKLTGHIAWSWFWVISPILIPIIVGLSLIGIGGLIILMAKLLE